MTLQELLQQAGINGPQDPSQPSMQQPQASPELTRRMRREERVNQFQSLIDNFTYSLGSGLTASAHAPGGARNRTNAGIGAALTAPFQLQAARQQYALQQAREEQERARTELLTRQTENQQLVPITGPDGQTQMVPAKDAAAIHARMYATQQQAATAASGQRATVERLDITEAGKVARQQTDITAREKAAKEAADQKAALLEDIQADRLQREATEREFDAQQNKAKIDAAKERAGIVAAGRGGATGVAPADKTTIRQIASQFDSSPIVKNYNEVTNRYDTAKGVINGKMGGPGDVAIVYEFMKALDPTSVVREEEYKKSATAGNIFAGWAAKFNGYLKPDGGFLPENVKREFLSILEQKKEVTRAQYRNLRNEATRQINKWTGGEDGADYLKEYEPTDSNREVYRRGAGRVK